MAITKIHRTSKITLTICIIISILVMGLFYLGGQAPVEEMISADLSQPKFTDIMLYWCYVLLFITVVVLVLFAVFSFFKQLKENPKKALGGFIALIGLVAMLVIFYTIGSGKPLNIPGYSGSDNVPPMLKMTDMWLYSSYLMLVLTVASILVSPLLKRKK
jgi:amino acid transporter